MRQSDPESWTEQKKEEDIRGIKMDFVLAAGESKGTSIFSCPVSDGITMS